MSFMTKRLASGGAAPGGPGAASPGVGDLLMMDLAEQALFLVPAVAVEELALHRHAVDGFAHESDFHHALAHALKLGSITPTMKVTCLTEKDVLDRLSDPSQTAFVDAFVHVTLGGSAIWPWP